MKTVVFLKDHLEHTEGKEHEVTDEQAHYFERCNVAVVKKKADKPEKKEPASDTTDKSADKDTAHKHTKPVKPAK